MEAFKRTIRTHGIKRLIVVLALLSWGAAAWGQAGPVELLLEKNPTEGGMVTPGSGIHRFSADSEITVTAVPQPGYRFAYWLGEVSQPGESTTRIHLNDSKAVVAVFERVTPDLAGENNPDIEINGGGGGGPSSLMPTATNFFTTNWSISSGAAASPTVVVSGPILIQTPEPATVLLFGLGGSYLIRRPRRQRRRGIPGRKRS
jgi:hypothetical protein